MLWWLVVIGAGVVAGKMADMEGRAPVPWGIGASVATLGLTRVLGAWFGAAPFAALAGVFGLLWVLRSRDDRDDPPGRLVR